MANKTRVYGKEVIDEILHRYIEENDITGDIRYSNVRDFALELWKNNDPIFTDRLYYQLVDKCTGETSGKVYKNVKLSDDFWRKPQYQGRQKIDAVNTLLSQTVAETKKRQIYIPNVEYILETHKNNIKQLKLNLIPLEEQLKISIKKEETLEDRVEKLEKEARIINEEKRSLKQQNDKLQQALYKMFEYSASREVPLENQLNTGKGKTKRVEQALKEAFSGDPTSFYEQFKNNQKKDNETNLSDLEEYKNKKESQVKAPSYANEYDFE